MVEMNFRTEGIDTKNRYDPIPAGKYHMHVFEIVQNRNKLDTGSYLKVEFQVLDGPHENRRVFYLFNVDHPNDQTVEIAQKELAQLTEAVGLDGFSDTDELLNQPFIGTVGIRRDLDYGAQNTMRGFSRLEETEQEPKKSAQTKPTRSTSCGKVG